MPSDERELELLHGQPFNEIYNESIGQKRVTSVERVHTISRNEFKRRVATGQCPLVFRSPFPRANILDVLRTSDLSLVCRIGDYCKPVTYAKSRRTKLVRIDEYLDRYFTKSPVDELPYAACFVLPESILKSLNLVPPCFFPESEFELPKAWLGGTGCSTPLHKDGSKNIAIHVVGSKRWTLFPPRDALYLYLERTNPMSDFAFSHIDLRDPRHGDFPLFRNAQSIQVTVRKDEALFIPEGWSHFVENLEPTLMINYWHKSEATKKWLSAKSRGES